MGRSCPSPWFYLPVIRSARAAERRPIFFIAATSSYKNDSLTPILTLRITMNSSDRLAKLEKRSKRNILLRVFGKFRKSQTMSTPAVTSGPGIKMERERVQLKRYNPEEHQVNPAVTEVAIRDVDYSFFTTPLSYVVSYF